MIDQQFDVFLSHNSSDKPAVREVAEALKKRRLKVWLDEWELTPGQPWQEALEDIVETAKAAAVLVGKDGLGPWQDMEMRGCLDGLVRKKNAPVIPVLLPGAPNQPELPLFLSGFTWVDLRGGISEIGIDRLVWGITGKKPPSDQPPSNEGAFQGVHKNMGNVRRMRETITAKTFLYRSFLLAFVLVLASVAYVLLTGPSGLSPPLFPANPEERQIFVDERTNVRFVFIPAGSFLMGSTSDKAEDQEYPHEVTISSGFWLAERPVTNRQYAHFVNAARAQTPAFWGDATFEGDGRPVVGVSWNDANSYCEWAGYELPTEAMWEYACRAGTTSEYSFGDEAEKLGEYGWFNDNSGGQTQSIGKRKPNSWGLHDMHGNVWEWCHDRHLFDYYKGKGIGHDPRGPSEGRNRVVRGGSWGSLAEYCRSSYRYCYDPSTRNEYVGFRVAFRP